MTECNIATALDDEFVQHTSVMVSSLLSNASQPDRVHFHFIAEQLSERNIECLTTLVERFGAGCAFLYPSGERFSDLYVHAHITVESYFRLGIGDLLDKNIDRLIYLDGDTVVLDDIFLMWNTDLSGNTLGAVECPFMESHRPPGMDQDCIYFNAGVLLVDMNRWRERDVGLRSISHAADHDLLYQDQDALNVIAQRQVQFLPVKWNVQSKMVSKGFVKLKTATDAELEMAARFPSIVHFTGTMKPWHYMSYHQHGHWYYRYLKLTPWADFKPRDQTPRNVMRKRLSRFKRLISRIVRDPDQGEATVPTTLS